MTVTERRAAAGTRGRGVVARVRTVIGSHAYGARILLSLGLFALVILVRVYIHFAGSFPGDRYAIAHFSTPWDDNGLVKQWYNAIGDLGSAVVAGPFIVLSAIALWRHGYRTEAQGLLIACVALVANLALKQLFGPTPDWAPAHAGGINYPSGHTSYITAVFGYLGAIAWRRGQREIAFAAAVTIIFAGPARVISGNHIVGDVVGGYLLGAAFLCLALTWVKWRNEQDAAAAGGARRAAAAAQTAGIG